MSKINLPYGSLNYLPDVPKGVEDKNPEIHKYLNELRREMIKALQQSQDNHEAITTAINSTA